LEPLFVKFVNFRFKHEPLQDFFAMLNSAGVEIPLEELFLYYRTEDKEYPNGPQFLTQVEKDKISKDLESDRQEFRNLLLSVINKRKFGTGLEKINLHCAEIPLQFTYHKKDPGKLDLAAPSVESLGEVGWANFILGLVAVDLGKFLMENPVNRIRSCKKKDCGRLFTRRGGKAIFCSDYCRAKFHYNEKKDSGYFRKFMKERRPKGIYQPKKKDL
jgi:hypothetical protein